MQAQDSNCPGVAKRDMSMPISATTTLALTSLKPGIVLYANAALQGALAGMHKVLTVLRESRRIDEDPALLTPFAERQRLFGKAQWDALEARYA
jgi:hypothetical protein